MVAFFYAYDSLISPPRPAQIQAALGVLMGLLNRVGLQTNVLKTIHGVSALPYFHQALIGGVYMADYGSGSILLVEAAG